MLNIKHEQKQTEATQDQSESNKSPSIAKNGHEGIFTENRTLGIAKQAYKIHIGPIRLNSATDVRQSTQIQVREGRMKDAPEIGKLDSQSGIVHKNINFTCQSTSASQHALIQQPTSTSWCEVSLFPPPPPPPLPPPTIQCVEVPPPPPPLPSVEVKG